MRNGISLYNITSRFVELFEKAENEELTEQEITEQGNALAKELQNKSANIVAYTKELELTSNAIKEEIDRLKAVKEVIDNKNERLKEYVKDNMQRLNIEKIETPLGILKIAKNPDSVEIFDESLIADEYKKEKISYTIDKTAIKEAIKTGKEVQGARLVTDKTSLRIK